MKYHSGQYLQPGFIQVRLCQVLVWYGYDNQKVAPNSKSTLQRIRTIFENTVLDALRTFKSHFRLSECQDEDKKEKKKNDLSKGQRKLKKRHEKSVMILILIVTVFVVCHSFRLGVQTYQVGFLCFTNPVQLKLMGIPITSILWIQSTT